MAEEEGPPPGGGSTKTGKRKKPPRTEDQKEQAKRLRRGGPLDLKKVADKKLRGRLSHAERVVRESQAKAVKVNEWLLPSEAGVLEAEGVERTWNFKQEAIVQHVEQGAARKAFDLSLPDLGPYHVAFTRSGRFMVLGGTKGHLAVMDRQRSHLVCEVQVAETTRAVTFLHNELFFAAAQKKYVYIYDKRGIEVHCLRDHGEANALDFLPQHFLLTSIGDTGVLRFQDTSTGHVVAQHRTQLGPCHVLRHNPYNAVSCLGHARGVVTMWTPNVNTPVVKMLCHRGPVTALAVDPLGHYMVTAGADSQVRVWDVRALKPMHSYFAHAPVTQVDISQRGMLGLSHGRRVQVWRDALRTKAAAPYMVHDVPGGHVAALRFCPYEDLLGLGHAGGVSTMLVPGAGEPNFDSLVANPFQSTRERQQQEVAHLLDKLQPDTIVLDPSTIGKVLREPLDIQRQRQAEAEAANRAALAKQRTEADARAPMKGKNRPSKRHRKKQINIIEDRKGDVQRRIKEEEAKRKKEAAEKAKREEELKDVPKALMRFYKK